MKKYWYLFVMEFCPVCGRQRSWKERQFSRKPRDVNKRYITTVSYDWCEY